MDWSVRPAVGGGTGGLPGGCRPSPGASTSPRPRRSVRAPRSRRGARSRPPRFARRQVAGHRHARQPVPVPTPSSPIRQYAEEALVEAGEADGTRLAHARHYAALAREAEPHIRGRRQLEWGHRLDTDHDNLRAALVTLRVSGDSDAALDMAFDLQFYWRHDGWHREGIESTLRALQAGGAADPVRVCKGWFVAAVLALDITDPRSVGYAENGLAVARELGDRAVIGRLTAPSGRPSRTPPTASTATHSCSRATRSGGSTSSRPGGTWPGRRATWPSCAAPSTPTDTPIGVGRSSAPSRGSGRPATRP